MERMTIIIQGGVISIFSNWSLKWYMYTFGLRTKGVMMYHSPL